MLKVYKANERLIPMYLARKFDGEEEHEIEEAAVFF